MFNPLATPQTRQKAAEIVANGTQINSKYETTSHSCKCMAQAMNVNRRNGQVCKHILAVRLARSIQSVQNLMAYIGND